MSHLCFVWCGTLDVKDVGLRMGPSSVVVPPKEIPQNVVKTTNDGDLNGKAAPPARDSDTVEKRRSQPLRLKVEYILWPYCALLETLTFYLNVIL